MSFNVEITLPSGKKTRVKELKNSEYLTIVKFCHNKDLIGLSKYFESLFKLDNLNIIERFYLLIYVRMLFIDSEIVFIQNNRHVKLDLATMLDKLESSYISLDRTISDGEIEMTLDLPYITHFETIDSLFISTITSVKVGNTSIDFTSVDEEGRVSILNNLPASTFTYIESFIDSIQDNLLNITLIDENRQLEIESLEINILGNGLMNFISLLYNTNLEDFYNLIYLFQNTVMPGSNLFLNMSPIETQIILNAHHKKIKQQADALQKQQN